MNKIAVYYIATDKYINFFSQFLNSLKLFFPNVKKKVILITDDEKNYIDIKTIGNIEIKKEHIDHHFWPIPTLFKMFYIQKFFAYDCDYHFYCNANMNFLNEFEINDSFDMCFMGHYLNDRLPFYTINYGNCNNCIVPPNWAKCHISKEEIPKEAKYCQAGFFGGKSDNVLHLLKSINEMLKDDLKHNIIPIWHDETYLNKYLLKYYWNENKIGEVKLVNIRDYVEFMDKNKYFDKFNL